MIDGISFFKSKQLSDDISFARKETENTLLQIDSSFCKQTIDNWNSRFNPETLMTDIEEIKSNVYNVLMELELIEKNIPLIDKGYKERKTHLETLDFKIVLRIFTSYSAYPRETNVLRFSSMKVPVDIDTNTITSNEQYVFEKFIFYRENRVQRPLSHSLAFTEDLYDFLVHQKVNLDTVELIFSDNVPEQRSSRIISHFDKLRKKGVR